MGRDATTLLRNFHQARWDEQIICEMSVPGERGVLVPETEEAIAADVGDGISVIPGNLRRKTKADLPEISQMRVLRHYLHLSQETMGTDVTIDISQGTCTMKYTPKVFEHLAAHHPGMTAVHPLQDVSTIQGTLEMYYKFEQFLCELSGMDSFSFQPGGGAHGVFTNASIVRAYHAARGEGHRDEAITTMFSHPCDAAAPATAGYKMITLMPDENGYPDIEAFRAAVSERTAAIFITNPEDTGVYNPRIDEFVRIAHEAGAICVYDQANVNGMMGIARAREAGFDLCHFNCHKTFATPHACMGPATGAIGATAELAKYLPVPRIEFDGERYSFADDTPESIGKVRSFYGHPSIVMRGYAWFLNHGADGLREVAEIAVLNSNYMEKKLREIDGVKVYYAEGKRRLEQVRYSWEPLMEETGVGTEDIMRRMTDYGLQHYWMSHHPWVVPEPFTLEPCESYSKDDIDEYVAVLRKVAEEARETPELVKSAPHNSVVHKVVAPAIDEPERIAPTWRVHKKRRGLV